MLATGKPQPPFGIETIKQCIPHRDPMLMLTKVIALDESGITAQNCVPSSADVFKGHFPDRPILPGVLIIETIAQAGAMLVELTGGLDSVNQFMAFSGVDRAKFRTPVKPDDIMSVHVQIVKHRRTLYKFSGIVHVGDAVAAEVDFTAMIMSF